jgi:phosphatidylglycerophosphate synthase
MVTRLGKTCLTIDKGKMRTSELRSICQKGEGELFLISAYVYRPFTIYVSRLYLFLGIRGNTITFHSLVCGLTAGALTLFYGPVFLLVAALFLQLYFVLDHVDGEVARFDIHQGRQKRSLAGEFFDFWTHFHTVNLFFAFMGLGLFLETGNPIWAVLGILGANISGNFQRMPAANVVLCSVARGDVNIHDAQLEPILDVCCGFSLRKRFGGTLSVGKKIYFFLSEFLGFPGNVIALTGVLIGDGVTGLFHPGFCVFRAAYLAAYCSYGILSKTARTLVTMRQLSKVTPGQTNGSHQSGT